MPTIAQLKAELDNDPAGLGYAGKGVTDTSALLNTPGAAHGTVDVQMVTNTDLQSAVVASEWAALANANLERLWLAVVGMETIPIHDANIRNQILEVWGPGTATRTNLAGLQTRQGTRAEALWGVDTYISNSEINEARRS
jgi:hypothetical protein